MNAVLRGLFFIFCLVAAGCRTPAAYNPPANPACFVEEYGDTKLDMKILWTGQSLEELARNAKPTLILDAPDADGESGKHFVWACEDDEGRTFFRVNEPIRRSDNSGARWILVSGDGRAFLQVYDVECHRNRQMDEMWWSGSMTEISLGRKLGTLFQIDYSKMADGSGHFTTYWTFFLLRDPNGRWRHFATGPTGWFAQDGGWHYGRTNFEYCAVPAADPDSPVELRITRRREVGGGICSGRRSVEIRRDGLLVPPAYKDIRWTSGAYILTQKEDSLEELAEGLTAGVLNKDPPGMEYPGTPPTSQSDWDAAVKFWRNKLVQLNPKLKSGVIPDETRILLPAVEPVGESAADGVEFFTLYLERNHDPDIERKMTEAVQAIRPLTPELTSERDIEALIKFVLDVGPEWPENKAVALARSLLVKYKSATRPYVERRLKGAPSREPLLSLLREMDASAEGH